MGFGEEDHWDKHHCHNTISIILLINMGKIFKSNQNFKLNKVNFQKDKQQTIYSEIPYFILWREWPRGKLIFVSILRWRQPKIFAGSQLITKVLLRCLPTQTSYKTISDDGIFEENLFQPSRILLYHTILSGIWWSFFSLFSNHRIPKNLGLKNLL